MQRPTQKLILTGFDASSLNFQTRDIFGCGRQDGSRGQCCDHWDVLWGGVREQLSEWLDGHCEQLSEFLCEKLRGLCVQLCGLRYELLDGLRELCDFLPESKDGLHEQLSECLGEWLDGQLGQARGPCDGQVHGVGLSGLQDVVQEGRQVDEE